MDRQALRREILEALKFYADFNNWCQQQKGGISSVYLPAAVQEDLGKRAKAVLDRIAAAKAERPGKCAD